jgi:hypothetical protein
VIAQVIGCADCTGRKKLKLNNAERRKRKSMKKILLKGLMSVAVSSCAAMLHGASMTASDVVVENARFKLTIGADAVVKSLVAKHSGEKLLSMHDPVAIC